MLQTIEVLRGSCVTIPCSFHIDRTYKTYLDQTCKAMWKKRSNNEVVFDSKTRTNGELIGALTDKDCTTTLNNMVSDDTYLFRLECENVLKWDFNNDLINIVTKADPPSPTLTPSTLEVEEGTSVSVTCSAPAPCLSHPPTLTWSPRLGDSQETLQENQDKTKVQTSVLTFTASHLHHGWKISCTALYRKQDGSNQSSSSKTSALTVSYPPKDTTVSVSPSGPVPENINMTLTCSSTANPAVRSYTWYTTDGDQETFIGTGNILKIEASKVNSPFFCKTENDLGVGRSTNTQIDVQYPPKDTILSVSPSGPVPENRNVTLTCSSTANPAVRNYTWYRTDGDQETFIGTGHILKIEASKVSSPFFCKTENDLGVGRSTNTQIDVEYPPKDTTVSVSPSGPVPENRNVTLTCSSTANPAVRNYTWYRTDGDQGTFIGTGHILMIEASKVSSPFFCKTENDLGVGRSTNTQIDVQYPPKDTTVSVSPSGPVPENRNVTLTCSSTANPAVRSYTWYRTDGDQETFIGTGNILKIEASKVSSPFFCKTENDLGVGRSTNTQIDVQYPPKDTTVSVSPSGPVPENRNVTLTCSSTANPAVRSYTWYRTDGDQETFIGTGHILKIEASKVSSPFFCKTENDLGVGRSTNTQIDVQYPPKDTTVSVSPSGPVPENRNVTLACSSTANPAVRSYTWYRNDGDQETFIGTGNILKIEASKVNSPFICKTENDLGVGRSTNIQIDVQYPPKDTTVSVSPSGPVPENRNVTLTCSSTANPAARSYTWYRTDGDQETFIGTGHILKIEASKVSSPFFCKTENDLGVGRSTNTQIDVQYPPKDTTVSVSPSGPVPENRNVTLTCSSTANPAVRSYTWYRTDGDQETFIGTGHILKIEASKVSSPFFCKTENDLGVGRSTNTQIDVQYPPKDTTVSVSPSGPVPENRNVTLTCSSTANPTVRNYTWYRTDGDQETFIGTGNILKIEASKVNSPFFCKTENDLGVGRSTNTQIDVQYPPKDTTVSVSPSGPVPENRNVTLTCSSTANPAVRSYTWYRTDGDQETFIGTGNILKIEASKVSSPFFCKTENDLGVGRSTNTQIDIQYPPKDTTVSVSPSGPVPENRNVTLTCSSTANPAVRSYTWYRNDGDQETFIGTGHILTIEASKVSSPFFCKTENDLGVGRSTNTQIDVQYPPKNTTVSVSPSGPVPENRNVTLTCSSTANPAVRNYTWYRTDGDQETFIGTGHILTIEASKVSSPFFCKTENDLGVGRSTNTQIDVQYPPKDTTVSVSPSGPVPENRNVTLTCSSTANPAVRNYTWYRTDRDQETFIGTGHILKIEASKVSSPFFCKAENDLGVGRSTNTQIDVQYPPKDTTVSVSPSGPVPENRNVTLTCSSTANPAVRNYTWYRTDRDQETFIGTGNILKIEASKVSSPFFCKTENDLGVGQSTNTQIDVQYPPKNTTVSVSPSGPVPENRNVTLTCSSTANPAVRSYTWYRTDGDQENFIGTGHILTIEASKVSSSFFCKTENDLGVGRSTKTQIDVQYPPKDTTVSVSPSGSVPENRNVTLTCSSTANPAVRNYTWYRTDRDQETFIGTGHILKIEASKVSSPFFCKTENDLGVGRSTNTQIDVQFPPQILASSHCTKTESQVNCSCETVGNPSPTLHWYLDGRPVNQSGEVLISSGSLNGTGLRSFITVNKLKERSLSTLFCHSFNSLGSARQQFNVTEAQSSTESQGLGHYCGVLPWALAGGFFSSSVFFIICTIFLCKSRRNVEPNAEDRTYMSLDRRNVTESSEYDVITRRPK
ncbi:hemicentin-2-like isoform X7 [Mugil cephalus]|uniref:hemicentin-2-like isoform X7 n=1 Tax=Mugil cephalus TaxID=48193 RepID=UPI001FB5D4D4|nr:hemicentin-2-like isoform X7 [Mugil cephalus]